MNQLGSQSLIGRRNRRSREAGIALIAVMLILALVSVLAVSSMESTMRDQQIAGVQMRDRVAFQAAEAGLATALVSVTGSNTPTLAPVPSGFPVTTPWDNRAFNSTRRQALPSVIWVRCPHRA